MTFNPGLTCSRGHWLRADFLVQGGTVCKYRNKVCMLPSRLMLKASSVRVISRSKPLTKCIANAAMNTRVGPRISLGAAAWTQQPPVATALPSIPAAPMHERLLHTTA